MRSCLQLACASCLFSCNQHLCVVLVSASYRHSLLETSDWMCFVVLETLAFRHAILDRICGLDSLPGFYSFEAWFKLTEDLVVVPAEQINCPKETLSMFRWHSEDDASLRFVVDECVDFWKLEACNLVYNVVGLLLKKEGPRSGLCSFLRMLSTMVDNFLPLHNSCSFDVVAVSEGTIMSCVSVVQIYMAGHSDPMYDVLPESVV